MWACRRTGRTSKRRLTDRGISIVEVMLVTVLMAIFFGAVYESVIVGLRAANAADEREDIRQQLVTALDRLTREASLASNVDNAEDQRFQFDADIDGSGSTENNLNYRVQDGDLQRDYSSTTVTLVRDLATLDFDYTDLNGATMTTPVGNQPDRDTIRVVQITMSATRDNETISMASAAYLRNNQ